MLSNLFRAAMALEVHRVAVKDQIAWLLLEKGAGNGDQNKPEVRKASTNEANKSMLLQTWVYLISLLLNKFLPMDRCVGFTSPPQLREDKHLETQFPLGAYHVPVLKVREVPVLRLWFRRTLHLLTLTE